MTFVSSLIVRCAAVQCSYKQDQSHHYQLPAQSNWHCLASDWPQQTDLWYNVLSGHVWSAKELDMLVKFCNKNDLLALSDEVRLTNRLQATSSDMSYRCMRTRCSQVRPD